MPHAHSVVIYGTFESIRTASVRINGCGRYVSKLSLQSTRGRATAPLPQAAWHDALPYTSYSMPGRAIRTYLRTDTSRRLCTYITTLHDAHAQVRIDRAESLSLIHTKVLHYYTVLKSLFAVTTQARAGPAHRESWAKSWSRVCVAAAFRWVGQQEPPACVLFAVAAGQPGSQLAAGPASLTQTRCHAALLLCLLS
jgi:hypothetical protein